MSVSQIVFVLDTINDVERAVRIQVGSSYTLFLYNWKSINYKDILVMTEKFNRKKKSMKWKEQYQKRGGEKILPQHQR